MLPKGQLQYFHSPVDDALHPCAVCATDALDEPKPLILEVSPGALNDLPGAVAQTEEIAGIASRHGRTCVVARPTGRGPGSVYQNYGEVDVLEAIEHVAANYPIDRNRITITGASMGGAAVWYMVSHYPDLFAAAAPFCGYCDYRLWEKPGGTTFHMHEWEEYSWQARSAALLVENLEHTPVWMVHGEWDRAVGGGVPVEHSRQMAAAMAARGYRHTYTEVPRTGHSCREPRLWEEVILWLLEQRRTPTPEHVALAAWDLRHNRSYWVALEQLEHYGCRGHIDARLEGGEQVLVISQGVRTFSLGPLEVAAPLAVVVDGQELDAIDLRTPRTFRRHPGGAWEVGDFDLAGEKRPGSSGPLGDLFHEGTILVPGTVGAEEEKYFNNWVADNARTYYSSRNGGVHRGGIMGESWVELPLVEDCELGEDDFLNCNLLLYGTYTSNAVLARFQHRLGLEFSGDSIRLAGRTYAAAQLAIFAVFPHPENPRRYVAVHGGVSPDAICWGTHLDMQLLPDYLVYAGGEVLDWGFWGNDWGLQSENT